MRDSETQSPRGNSIKKRQQKVWELRAACLENHITDGSDLDFDPRPRFFNAMIQYYSVLRPYISNREDMEDVWEEREIEGLGEGGLKQLDDWRFKTSTQTVEVDDPNMGKTQREIEQPDYLDPATTAEVVDILEDVTRRLGFSAEADEVDHETKIDKDLVEQADERAKELRMEYSDEWDKERNGQ